MTINDIKKLIASGESSTLELKKTTGELKDGMHYPKQQYRLTAKAKEWKAEQEDQ